MESNEKEATVMAMDHGWVDVGEERERERWELRQLREQGQVAFMNASIQRANELSALTEAAGGWLGQVEKVDVRTAGGR
jgi:hypothetical protein